MAYAETAFDPAQYTEEELREIDTLIHMHLTKTEEGTVLYDENGIYSSDESRLENIPVSLYVPFLT